MGKGVLIIRNHQKYPEISREMSKLVIIFKQLEYETWLLDESIDIFESALEEFMNKRKRVMECKAIITCNAIEIERLSKEKDFLYCTFLQEHSNQYYELLKKANENSIIFCRDKKDEIYIKENYSYIKNVLFFDGIENESWKTFFIQIALEIQEQVAIKQGNASVLKLLIQRELNSGNFQKVEKYIMLYKEQNPEDMDLIAIETIYNLYNGNLDIALQYALKGVKCYPCNADMYYNLANIYEKQEDWYRALINYEKSSFIYSYMEDDKRDILDLDNIIRNCKKNYELHFDNNKQMTYQDMLRNKFGLSEDAFRGIHSQIIGRYYWSYGSEKWYVGVYRDYIFRRIENHDDLLHTKGEFVKVVEGNYYKIEQTDVDVLLPIAVENPNTIHEIQKEGKKYIIQQEYNKHFNYYRLSPGSEVYSSMKSYYGKPISLCHKKNRKRLVLNIFVDGLAQCIIGGVNLAKIMPYTAQFFDKGIICTNTYSTADWTYPSIASYITGVDSIHHMLLHNQLDSALPEEYPTIAEYFHEQGYFTSTIGGNWRATPISGHARGYDQFVYQHEWVGFKAEMVVGEVIDQIEAFKETDQFLWITIGDLHDIGDGLDLPNSVQSQMRIEERMQEAKGVTSVKQNYSVLKTIAFERMAKRIDVLLNTIYQYLESNYKEDDLIISLFADHGQGYFVRDNEHFMAKGRSNVAFMFRGAGIKMQKCEEIISTSDYIHIMCKLANIKMKNIQIDGRLPKAFGGEGREYALSESIHPHDPYYAAIYSKDMNFFFQNPYPVQDDGRFYLKQNECIAWLTDKYGNVINDNEKLNYYYNIILKHIKPLLIYD